MNRRRQILIGVVALAAVALGLVVVGRLRMMASGEFSQRHRVQSPGGTNHVVRLQETTVGKTDHGAALIVYARLENPNPFEVVLDRRNFVLMDREKNYYLPSTTGTQTPLIKLPAHGVSEREMLSYSVLDEALAGVLALQIGNHYWVQLKSGKPFQETLRVGEFRSFRRQEW